MPDHEITRILNRTDQLIAGVAENIEKVRKIRERLLQVKLNNKIKNIKTMVIDYSCTEEVSHAHS